MGFWGPFIFFALLRNHYISLSFAATLEHNNNNTLTDDGNDKPSPVSCRKIYAVST